jgi:hypothetical protein
MNIKQRAIANTLLIKPSKDTLFFRIRLIAFYLSLILVLAACGGSSQGSNNQLITSTLPDEIYRYRSGDIVDFEGTLSLLNVNSDSQVFPVEVRMEFLPGTRTYLDKQVLRLRTNVYFVETSGEQVTEQSIWQETDGELFELTDNVGNVYVTENTNQQGLIAIPTPFDPAMSTEASFDFHTEYGGNVSGAVTTGERIITRGVMENLQTPIGQYQSYQVIHRESYEYVFSYGDYLRGSTIAIERTQWISPIKGQIKKLEILSEYSPSGTLLAVYRWELNLKNTNF